MAQGTFSIPDNMTSEQCLEQAAHWLENALKYEEAGKSIKLVSVALDRACAFENRAFELKNLN